MSPEHRHVMWAISELSEQTQDPWVSRRAKEILDLDPDDAGLRPMLHELLDICTHGALTTGIVMQALDLMWRAVGGQLDDPAPWREKFGSPA